MVYQYSFLVVVGENRRCLAHYPELLLKGTRKVFAVTETITKRKEKGSEVPISCVDATGVLMRIRSSSHALHTYGLFYTHLPFPRKWTGVTVGTYVGVKV